MTHVVKNALCLSNDLKGGWTSTWSNLPVVIEMDLKTAFLQGEAYDDTRDIICQIPPEYG